MAVNEQQLVFSWDLINASKLEKNNRPNVLYGPASTNDESSSLEYVIIKAESGYQFSYFELHTLPGVKCYLDPAYRGDGYSFDDSKKIIVGQSGVLKIDSSMINGIKKLVIHDFQRIKNANGPMLLTYVQTPYKEANKA